MRSTFGFENTDCNSCTLSINSHVVSSIAASKTCGLAMLVDKLLQNGINNAATKHLVSTLINRIHHNSISITPSSGDNCENFIVHMIETANQLSQTKEQQKTAIDSAAKLLTHAIREFEKNLDFSALEHNWKEFIYQFFRYRLALTA